MLIYDAAITGSFSYNGVDISDITSSEASVNALNQFTSSYNTGSFTGSFRGNGSGLNGVVSASFATNALTASYASNALTASFAISASQAANAVSASYASNALTASFAISASQAADSNNATSASQATNANNATSASQAQNAVSSSFASTATSASQAQNAVSSSFATNAANADLLDGKNSTEFAITGSNIFTGIQYNTDTTNPNGFGASASIYTDGGLRVTKDTYVSGTIYVNNLTVFGTQSINYVTSSQLNISTNIISVNTDTPSIRFGGLAVYDSGSTQLTGSILWDSERDHWVYSNPSGSSYNSGMLISGPRNSGSLGTEQGTINNVIVKGQGGDHVTSSQIIDDGTTVRIPGDLQVTGSIYTSALTGSLNGSNLVNASVANAKLTNSTISGIALGSNLATLTIGTGLSGTSYNGSGAVTIANTGVTSIVAGTNISISGGTGAVTITNGVTNNNQLTNGAGYITSTGTAAAVSQNIAAGSEGNLVFATIGTNDFFRIRGGGSSNAGFIEMATADDGTEPIYVRQYTGEFTTLARTATLLDDSGNTQFPGYLRTAGVTSSTVLFSAGTNSVDFGNALGQGTSSRSTFFRGNTNNVSVWWGGIDGNGANIPYAAIDATAGEFKFWRNTGGTGGGTWTNIMTMNASGLTMDLGGFIGNVTGTASGNVVARSQSNWNDSTVINNVAGLLAWKNYGNGHVIFDASQGTSPSGGGVSQTNATNAWQASFPTLMGWNGGSTYGVRVDSARVADNITAYTINQSLGTGNGPTFTGLTVNTSGTSTWGPFVVTSTNLWGDGATQYVTIGAGGAAGIMISNPHIVWNSGNTASALRMGRSGGVSTGAWYEIGTGASDNFFIAKNGLSSGTQFNIASNGSIVMSSPLYVVGTGTVITMGEQGSNAKQLLFGIDSSNGTSELQSVWQNNSYTRLNLNPVAGAVYAGATRLDTLSDSRVKDNIQPIAGALDKVLAITGKKFHLKDEEEGKIRYGFIAQELEGILDEFVLQTNMTFKKDDLEVENVKSIDNWASSWAALLVEAIKEQQTLITALQEKLERNNII